MTERLTGGCSCGAVRCDTGADPLLMLNCHCRDCQKASGGPYATFLIVPKAAVWLQGGLRYHRRVGESGKAIKRGFCQTCGSPVVTRLERLPELLGLQAGSLDDPSRYRAAMDILTDSAQPWDHMHPDTRKVPRGL